MGEQDPNFQDGDYPCPPSVFPVNYHEEQEEQVDENYDPTDFLQGLVPGEAPAFQPPPMVLDDGTIIKPEPGAMSDDHLQDDLAVSDDSEDEDKVQGHQPKQEPIDPDDPMAF